MKMSNVLVLGVLGLFFAVIFAACSPVPSEAPGGIDGDWITTDAAPFSTLLLSLDTQGDQVTGGVVSWRDGARSEGAVIAGQTSGASLSLSISVRAPVGIDLTLTRYDDGTLHGTVTRINTEAVRVPVTFRRP